MLLRTMSFSSFLFFYYQQLQSEGNRRITLITEKLI